MKFIYWIGLFLILLISIPIFAMNDQLGLAKVLGVITVVLVSVAVRIWTKNSRKKSIKKERIPIDRNDLFWLEKEIPFYAKLNKADRKVFQDRVALFIAAIPMVNDEGAQMEKENCLIVASDYIIQKWAQEFNLPTDYSGIKTSSAPDIEGHNCTIVDLEKLRLKVKGQ